MGFPGQVWNNREMEILKQYEKEIIPQADLFIIQDFQREESFFENLGIPHHPNILHFPGSVSDLSLPAETDYWHDIYNLSPYTRVMLSVGQFNKFNLKEELVQQFLETPHKLAWVLHGTFTDELRERLQNSVDPEPSQRRLCDYIAGMTDRYLAREYERLCGSFGITSKPQPQARPHDH